MLPIGNAAVQFQVFSFQSHVAVHAAQAGMAYAPPPSAQAAPATGPDSAAAAAQRAALLAANPHVLTPPYKLASPRHALCLATLVQQADRCCCCWGLTSQLLCTDLQAKGLFDPTLPHYEADLEINDFPQHARWKVQQRPAL